MPAGIQDGDLFEHLSHDDFNVLIVNAHALKAVDFLNFVHQIAGQVFFAAGTQNVVQFGVALGEGVAGLHKVAVRRSDVLALGHQVFFGLADFRRNHQLAFALGFALVGDGTGDFRNHGHVLGLAHFKELGHAPQAAHDILGLGGFARLAGDDVCRAG